MNTDPNPAASSGARVLRRPGPFLPAVTAALLLAGCTTSYQMKVDAISKPAAKKDVSYRLRASDPNLNENTLRFKEAAAIVKTALSSKGMYEAPKPEMADVVVSVDYGIGPPKTIRERRTEPIYVTTPGRLYTAIVQTGKDKNGDPIFSAITRQGPPVMEYIGDREYWVTYVVYEKYIRLTARENAPAAEGRPPEEIWSIDITTEDQSKDLRKYLPILASAGIDYIGKDSGGIKTVTIKASDSTIAFIKAHLESARKEAEAAGPPPEARPSADAPPKADGAL